MVFGIGGSNGAICGLIKSKMAADGHLGITALSRVTLASVSWAFLLYHPSSEGDIVIVSVCLCVCLYVYVCLSVNTITPEPLEISSRNFQDMFLWLKGQTNSKMAI